MRLTKADGRSLLGAISSELESQRHRRRWREEHGITGSAEQFQRDQDTQRAEELRRVQDKISKQL